MPFGALTSRAVVTVHAGSCCVQTTRPCRSAPFPALSPSAMGDCTRSQGLAGSDLATLGDAGQALVGASDAPTPHGEHSSLSQVTTVPCCGSSTSADLRHHSILRAFCSFLLHSVGCCEMEVLTQSHSCATRLTPRQLRVQGLQPEALPNKASFALGFS